MARKTITACDQAGAAPSYTVFGIYNTHEVKSDIQAFFPFLLVPTSPSVHRYHLRNLIFVMATPAGPPSLGPPAAELAKGQKEGQAIIIWTVGMFCIFGWDYFMSLPAEIERIWRRKFTYVSVLYLLNRYYGLLEFAMVVPLMTTPITNLFSIEACSKIYRWEPVGALITTVLSQAIMGSRVYAMYGKSWVVAGILGTIMSAEFGVQAYTLTVVFPAPSPAPGIPVPCVAVGPKKYLVAFWAIPLLFDTVTFLLTFYKSYTFWKAESKSPTISVLFRDGLVYFAAIFSMNLINVILFVTQDTTLQAVNLPATLMLNIIMSCRLVLNLRAPQSVYKISDNPSGVKLPMYQQPSPPKNFLDLSVHSQSRGAVTMITTSETVRDSTEDHPIHYKH
ncbi:hypothetical protein L208DRAFT_176797 [Tricholoma matsutake]|nr:hypothetical protein L208DRAFT_176797 [Tricholoma matsutake 945]